MARGLPDYYRGVDIAYQALAQMIVRPKYGAASEVITVLVVTANTENEMVSVSGKGMVYGGSLYLASSSSQRLSLTILEVDGSVINTTSFTTSAFYSLTRENSSPIYLMAYNEVDFRYSVGISAGITFETGFRVLFTEEHGNTPIVICKVVYALV